MNKKVLVFFLTAIIILTITSQTYAEDQTQMFDLNYVQVIFDERNGAYSSDVNDILQAQDGTIYIGNSVGLISYNGRKFTRVGNGIISEVNSMMEDSLGVLWVGTNDNGLVVINEGQYTVYDKSNQFDSNCIRAVIPDKRAGVYVSTTGSLYHFDRNMECRKIENELCNFTVSMACNMAGTLAGITNSGEVYFVTNGEVQSGYAKSISDNVCTNVSVVGDEFLFSTYEGEIINVRYYNGRVSCARNQYPELTGINNIYDGGDRYWVLADSGMGYVLENVFTPVQFEGFDGYFQDMFMDYEGNYWLSSSKYGLLQLARNDFVYVSNIVTETRNLVNTTQIYRGMVYAGMDNGLVIFNQNTYETIENELTEMLKGVKINSIVSDAEGNIWIATYGSSYGVICYNADEIRIYNHENGLPMDSVSQAKVLDNDSVVAITKNGSVIIRGGQVAPLYDLKEGTVNSEIMDIVRMEDGKLMLCTDGDGILVCENGKIVEKITTDNGLSSDVVRRMVPYKEGYILVTGNAICYLKNGVITKRDFSYSGMFDAIAGSGDDILILSSSGIFKMNGTQLVNGSRVEYELFNYDRGFQGSLTSNARCGADRAGNVYLCCQDGIVAMSLVNNQNHIVDYKIGIKSLKMDDVPVKFTSYADLPVGEGRLVIEPIFTKFGYEQLTISYYLEGYDQTMVVVDSADLPDEIVYSNLPGGSYVFHIELSRNNGRQVISSQSLTFNKGTAWYEKTIFKTAMVAVIVLILLLIGYTFMRMQVSSAEKKKNMYGDITRQTIMAIAKTIDAKDEYTNGHSVRVANYTKEIARRYGMKPDEVENIYYCGLLHDIGKIGIPDEILNKTSRLTDEEFAIIKTHPTKGAQILKDITVMPHIVEGAKYHHERYDGKGYNEGLCGKEIPLYARIIAVADTFDAMTTSRSYSKKKDFAYVKTELKRVAGTQLDPTFVNIMLQMINDGFIEEEMIQA